MHRKYVVDETRTVEVMATSPAHAIRIAEFAFRSGQSFAASLEDKAQELDGDTVTFVRSTEMVAREHWSNDMEETDGSA